MSVREHWSSRTTFVLAAIGSAIGLGNLIRFPYICSTNGGGAFVIAYIIALLTAGIPIMILEFGLGHISGGSAPKAFRQISPRLEWLGWIASGVGFFIVVYYAVIMAWCLSYFFDSFSIKQWAPDAAAAGSYFYNKVGVATAQGPFDFGGFRWGLLVSLVVVWTAIVASVWKGATTVSKVVYATVIIPWLILIVFVIRGVTLPGAMDGLRLYLTPNLSKLAEPGVWLAAYTQVFFSLTIGFGVMIAYASYLPKKSDLVKSAVIICVADSLTAFVAGLAVYGCLGYLSQASGVPIEELPVKGLGLAFIAYPQIIVNLPFGAVFFAFLFFLMLLTLGIDSAFSLLESFAAAVRDKWSLKHWQANLMVASAGLALGLPLITNCGLYWIDTMDHFLTFYGLGVVGLFECLIIADVFACERLRGHINEISDVKAPVLWDVMIMAIAPAALIAFIAAETWQRFQGSYEGYPRRLEFYAGWLVLILILVIARIFHALPWAKPKEEETVVEEF
jgi:NSS family neurotransmitter:Na+ symporter